MLKQKKLPVLIVTCLALFVPGLFLSACGAVQAPQQATPTPIPMVTEAPGVVSEGRLVPREHVSLTFPNGGTVAEVLVSEGDSVSAGQVLARLDQREQFALAEANAETELLNAQLALKDLNENADVISAQALKKVAEIRDAIRTTNRRINNLETASPQTDIDSAAADVVILKDRLDKAQDDFAAYENKPEDNLKRAEMLSKLADAREKYDAAVRLLNNLQGNANDIDLAIAEADLALYEAQLSLAEEEYAKVKNGPDPDDLALAQARVKAAETALTAAQAALSDTELKAPFAGEVARVDVKAGELLVPGQPAVVLADFSDWIVETDDLTEIKVTRVKPGDEVRLTFDAVPDLELTGIVESISSIDEEKFGDVTYTAKIRLAESDPRLRWGMTAVVNVEE